MVTVGDGWALITVLSTGSSVGAEVIAEYRVSQYSGHIETDLRLHV